MNTDTTKHNTWLTARNALVLLLGIACAYLLITNVIENRLETLEHTTKLLIEEQESVLSNIAVITSRNGADDTTEAIIKDCSVVERGRFDSLLSRLDAGLSTPELSELERLFGRCGSFFSERKSVMVARMAREFEIYQNYISQLEIITGGEMSDEYDLVNWQMLVDAEQQQSLLFSNLVQLQDQIITTLLSGSSPASAEIVAILREVQEVQEMLIVTNKQASTIRAELVSL